MSRKGVVEKKLDALADYLGVEFVVRDDRAMCIKDKDYRGKLSKTDIEKIVETLWKDKRYNDEFNDRIKMLERYLQVKLSKKISFAVEDQAKLYAISEIMKANYYEKIKKLEDDDNEI